jgi:large subunit ribosomal protein L23
MIVPNKILKSPIITEKASDLNVRLNQYTFKVYPQATKKNIAHAIETAWPVTVKKVNIINVKPKTKINRKVRGKKGRTASCKKALVTLKSGDKIEFI